MGDGEVCFRSGAMQISIHLIDVIRGRMVDAGLIEGVKSPLSPLSVEFTVHRTFGLSWDGGNLLQTRDSEG
jgi:hypothetical protein